MTDNETRNMMQDMARAIDMALNGNETPKPNGFVLLIFPFNQPEDVRIDYVSNAARSDIVVALKEIVARFEGQAEVKGHA